MRPRRQQNVGMTLISLISLANPSWQPTPGERIAGFWSTAARRGCTRRWASLARGTQQGGPAIDANQELAGGERGPKREDFQIFSSAIIFDRNSRICFHKCMETGALPKTNRARCRARTVSLITCSV
jgi:hypothetical protein